MSGWKQDRQDPRSKTWPSRLFNWVTGFLTGVRLHDFNSGFKIYRREVVQEIRLYGELHRFIPALAAWRGFQVTEVPVHHRARRYGRTQVRLGPALAGLPGPPDGPVPDPVHAAAASPLRGARADRVDGGVRGERCTSPGSGCRARSRSDTDPSSPSACSACSSACSSSPSVSSASWCSATRRGPTTSRSGVDWIDRRSPAERQRGEVSVQESGRPAPGGALPPPGVGIGRCRAPSPHTGSRLRRGHRVGDPGGSPAGGAARRARAR